MVIVCLLNMKINQYVMVQKKLIEMNQFVPFITIIQMNILMNVSIVVNYHCIYMENNVLCHVNQTLFSQNNKIIVYKIVQNISILMMQMNMYVLIYVILQ